MLKRTSGASRLRPGKAHRKRTLRTNPAGLLRPTALVHAAGLMRAGSLGALDAEAGRTLWRLHVEAASLLADQLVPKCLTAAGSC